MSDPLTGNQIKIYQKNAIASMKNIQQIAEKAIDLMENGEFSGLLAYTSNIHNYASIATEDIAVVNTARRYE